MKLINKLIPLTLVASTATVITPFAASCGKNDMPVEVNWNYTNGMYQFTTERIDDTTALGDDTATKKYFEAASKDKKIFAEDVVNKISWLQVIDIEMLTNFKVIPLNAHVTVDKVTYEKESTTGRYVGYTTFSVDFDGITLLEVGGYVLYGDYIAGTASFNNIPYWMNYNETSSTESPAKLNYWDLDQDDANENTVIPLPDGWSTSFEAIIPSAGTIISYNFDKNSDAEEVETARALMDSVSPDYTNYLSFVKHNS